MGETMARWRAFWFREIWHRERLWESAPPALGRLGVSVCRTLFVLVSSFGREGFKLRAAALTYVSLLSLVPLLAVAFSLFTMFGGLEQLGGTLEQKLLQSLVPSQQEVALEYLHTFIQSANPARLGLIGTVFLFVAVILLVADVERAFNDIWGVTRGRTWAQRLQVFWPLITVGPLLVALSFSVTATVTANELVRSIEEYVFGFRVVGRLASLLLTCSFFGFVYHIVPNTPVRWHAAMAGGFVGGGLWLLAQELYAAFAANAITYSAIYGSLSAIPVFMIWVFVSWNIALLGAVMTFAVQSARTFEPEREVTQQERELVAAQVVLAVAVRFMSGRGPSPSQALIDEANVPPRVAHQVLEALVDAGVLSEVKEADEMGYLPAQPLERMTLYDVLRAMRLGRAREVAGWNEFARTASRVLKRAEAGTREAAQHASVAQLAAEIAEDRSLDQLHSLGLSEAVEST